MKTGMRIITLLLVFSVASAILTPPDVISQIFLMLQMVIVCGVLVFIISRFKSYGQTPESIKKLIMVLVCLVSIIIPFAIMMTMVRDTDRSRKSYAVPSVVYSVPPSASYAAFSMGNLWVGYLSNPRDALSGEIEYVICSADAPKTCRFDGSTWMFTFSDNDDYGTGFGSGSNTGETVWMDKQHGVTHLGPVLSKEDVLLLSKHRNDAEFRISSPDELLALVKKLRAEQAARPEAAN